LGGEILDRIRGGSGLVESLARPGGNFTGLSNQQAATATIPIVFEMGSVTWADPFTGAFLPCCIALINAPALQR
jgi:hypothetical protein